MRGNLLMLGGLVAAFSPTASGAIVEFTFTGYVSYVDFSGGLFAGHVFENVAVGDSFEFRFRFESTTPDGDPDSLVGSYGPLEYAGITVESAVYEFAMPLGQIEIVNDPGFLDAFRVQLSEGPAAGGDIFDTVMNLENLTDTAFANDSLPTDLDFGAFDVAYSEMSLQIGDESDLDRFEAELTGFRAVTLPTPNAILLAGLALPLAAWLRRAENKKR